MKRKCTLQILDTGEFETKIKARNWKSPVCSTWCSSSLTDILIAWLLCSDATTQVDFGNFHEEASTLVSLEISKYPLAVLVVISDATGIAFWDPIFEQSVEQSPRRWHCNPCQTVKSNKASWKAKLSPGPVKADTLWTYYALIVPSICRHKRICFRNGQVTF